MHYGMTLTCPGRQPEEREISEAPDKADNVGVAARPQEKDDGCAGDLYEEVERVPAANQGTNQQPRHRRDSPAAQSQLIHR